MGAARRIAAVVTVGLVALTGCSDEPDPEPSPTPSTTSATPAPSTSAPSDTASPTPSSTVPAGFSLDAVSSPTFPELGGDLGGMGIVRVGHHPGYDRVVWEFEGAGVPQYRVQYVDEPLGDGSGDPVPVRGDAFIEVLVTSVGIPQEGTSRPPDASASSLSGTVIAEAMAIYGGFEGYGQTFIGVRDRERPFKVIVLQDPVNPTRLVVDIANG